MAASYNHHRQINVAANQYDHKPNCSLQDDSEDVSIKYINNRYSFNQVYNDDYPCFNQKIAIIIKNKSNIQQKKQNMISKNETTQQVKRSAAPSLITTDEFLKILAKKCSAPDVHKNDVHRKQKRRSSDICLNTSTPYKTKFIVNTVSLDPKRIPLDCQNLLNHPLMQAQMSIYRCQLKTHQDTRCRTCNSDAIFEVVKCLYDCYKKKKCNHCNCVMCAYLPKEMRKINEVNRSSVSVGVATPSLNRKTRATMTREEDEMIITEIKPDKQPKMTASEKLRIARAFGIMTPPESKKPHQNAKNTKYVTKKPANRPDDSTPPEKTLLRTNLPHLSLSQRIPSEKLRKARASGLLIPLAGKTPEQKENILRRLALNDIPLPEGKTESEKKVIDKVRKELGLPSRPRTFAEKERYAKAQAAGLITPLEGKSAPQKERILRTLVEYGIPMPKGRTSPEKALIKKIELDSLSKTMTNMNTEKTVKSRARSYMRALFNKFTTETGNVFLVETPSVKNIFRKFQVQGLFTSLESKAPEQEEKNPFLFQPKEAMLLKKGSFKKVGIGSRLDPVPQKKTQTVKVLREKRVTRAEAQVTTAKREKDKKKSKPQEIKIIMPLHETKTNQNQKHYQSDAAAEHSLISSIKDRLNVENVFNHRVKDIARATKVTLEKIQKAKEKDVLTSLEVTDSEKGKLIKKFAEVIQIIAKEKVPPENNIITKVRDKNKVLEFMRHQTSKSSKKVVKGMVANSVASIKESEAVVKTGMCERGIGCDLEKKLFGNSCLSIKLASSDSSKECIVRNECNDFTDSEGIEFTIDRLTSVPSFAITSTKETVNPDIMPQQSTKEFNSLVYDDGDSQISLDIGSLSTEFTNNDLGSKSTACFYFDNNDINNIKHLSHENIYELDLAEKSADLIYIYKPSFNGKGTVNAFTESTQITVKDSCANHISESISESFYLIETGSTDSCVSKLSEKVKRDIETSTDASYIQQCEDEYPQDTCPKHSNDRYFRNNRHSSFQNDTKIYQVSDPKLNTSHQQRNNPASQRTKKDLKHDLNCNVLNDSDEYILDDVQTASRQGLTRSSSIYIVISQSRHSISSSEDMDSVIYLEMSDSVSKLKTLKLLPREKFQKVPSTYPCTHHTRYGEKLVKYSAEQRTAFKCSEIRLKPTGHTVYRLPITKVFKRYPNNNSSTNNRGKRLEFSEKQQIYRKHLENVPIITGCLTRNKELPFTLSICSMDSSGSEKRTGYSRQQRIEPKYIRIGLSKTEITQGSKVPSRKGIYRYLSGGKGTSNRQKQIKVLADQRLTPKYSEICLISTERSSRCKVPPSKVSFGQPYDKPNLKYRGDCTGIPKEQQVQTKNLNNDTDPNKRVRWCTVCSGATSTCCTCDNDGTRNREKRMECSSDRKMAPNECEKGNKVHFGRMPTCCPCERKDVRNQVQPIRNSPESLKSTPNSTKSPECETKQNPSLDECPGQPSTNQQMSTDMPSFMSKACSSHCPEVMKKSTSPLNMDVQSGGVDAANSPTSENTTEQRTSVVPKNYRIPDGLSHGSHISSGDPKDTEGGSNRDNTEKQKTSEDPGNRQRSTEGSTKSPLGNEDATIKESIPALPAVDELLPAVLRKISALGQCNPSCPELTKRRSMSHADDKKSVELDAVISKEQSQPDPPPAESLPPCSDEKLLQQTDLCKGLDEKVAEETCASECKNIKLDRVGWCGKKQPKRECPPPICLVKEQTTASQCGNDSRPEEHNFTPDCVSKQNSTCECPSTRNDSNVPCQNDRKAASQKEQRTVDLKCQKKNKQSKPTVCECSDNSMELTKCQEKKLGRVQWDRKKYVISECPPPEITVEDDRKDCECSPSIKKRAKNQTATSCIHGAIPCLCKEKTSCRSKKNHKCECPCPPIVQEIEICPPGDGKPPCPTQQKTKEKQKKQVEECDQGQMTEDKIDKGSCTDGSAKNMCKTKNKASGRGRWGRKKNKTCSCPLDQPSKTDKGCDPPCSKELWRMRSDQTQSKCGFTVKKKPALRVDDGMCFEEALAYFEQHPEDDPMRTKRKKIHCECYGNSKCDVRQCNTMKFCIGGKCYYAIGMTGFEALGSSASRCLSRMEL